MLMNVNGELIEVSNKMNPYLQHKNGETAEMVLEYIRTHDDTNSPVFGDKEVNDLLGLVMQENCDTGKDLLDPKTIAIYGIYCGLAWAEKGF